MSNMSSPSRHLADVDNYYESNFTADISHKMRVPKHIRAAGDGDDDHMSNNHWISPMDLHEKFEMHVPDRILVVGQEQHIGTKAPPRELQLENAVMPPDPGFVRVQTPPRVISLDDHYIPTADEMSTHNDFDNYKQAHVVNTRNGPMTLNGNGDFKKSNLSLREVTPPQMSAADTSMSSMNLTPAEEVLMLRRQVVKLSRRVFAVENEVTQQQQREKVLLAIGIAYFLVKSVLWLSRSPS